MHSPQKGRHRREHVGQHKRRKKHTHPFTAQSLTYSVFRRSIPQNLEEDVVTAPRWIASFCWERKKKNSALSTYKSFSHGAVTTCSSKFWGMPLLKPPQEDQPSIFWNWFYTVLLQYWIIWYFIIIILLNFIKDISHNKY